MTRTEDYDAFLAGKRFVAPSVGFDVPAEQLSSSLFPFQCDIVRWALRKGRAAVFAGTGLGKTRMQLVWANRVRQETGGDVLILAPLAVSWQTAAEGEQIGVPVTVCRSGDDVRPGINITNYERLHLFDPSRFVAVVLDESSILKAYDGKTRTAIIEAFAATPYRLACTATPAPNDFMELGNHAEFLGVMSRTEMLAMFFVHDGGDTQSWRLKGHAESAFWGWMVSWSVMLRRPSDLGYDDGGFALPPLEIHRHIVESDYRPEGMLFTVDALSLTERRAARKASLERRVEQAVEVIRKSWASRGPNTGEPTTPPIENADLRTSGTRTTGIEKNDLPRGKRRERHSDQPSENGSGSTSVPTISRTSNDTASAEPPFSSDAMASMLMGSSGFSKCRAGGALSASKNRAADDGSTSTTITQLAPCGASSVTHAISCSDGTTTIPNDCVRTAATMLPPISKTRLDPWLIWVDLNDEQRALEWAFGDHAVSVYGSLSADEKESRLLAWMRGERPILICKPSIAGYGLNMQHCANVAFVGLSDSWESYYQAIRRCWRFGQTRPVNVHVIIGQAEGAVLANIEWKEHEAERMLTAMVEHMSDLNRDDLHQTARETDDYQRTTVAGEGWTLHLGDCVDIVAEMPGASIDYSIFSPPFASLYTYSNSPRDMGNCATHDEFYAHFLFLVRDLYRVLRPGRLLSFHCMNLPTSKARDGYIGIADFRGLLIKLFQDAGFIYHSEVVIWKDPVTAMQRTKALGLLYKQLRKDSCMSRQGIPDYLVTMRKPGENPAPVTKESEAFPVSLWQNYASPVWMDINPSDTLQRESAREDADEKHIAPLQLEVIRRAVRLWTNPGDLVLSPFAGIGSEGYVAVQEGRRFVGVELKASYWQQAVANLRAVEASSKQLDLFSFAAGMGN